MDSSYAIVEDLASVLDLEQIDRNLYRGVHGVDARARASLYGGQVAAQALRAAGLTVPEDRHPHSLHGYFLRPGRIDRPVILHVDRDRDGRSFSARHVAAVQDGEVIFSMLASFHVDEPSAELDAVARAEPVPDVGGAAAFGGQARPVLLLEVREVEPPAAPGDDGIAPDRLWVRAAHPLPKDRLVQACAVAYISDVGSGFRQVRRPGLPAGGPSIDHAVWFHAPVEADQWLLLELQPAKAAGARGVYVGSLRDATGRLAALIAQEMLLRS
ncbi:MAG TPA: acyl-CoA thioesterase domain-containing protein [Acidimicrobiales bacterium]|nr:acyl-CoA thioesterase domain-containing protein [Acidimicrobiales bacterium]